MKRLCLVMLLLVCLTGCFGMIKPSHIAEAKELKTQTKYLKDNVKDFVADDLSDFELKTLQDYLDAAHKLAEEHEKSLQEDKEK